MAASSRLAAYMSMTATSVPGRPPAAIRYPSFMAASDQSAPGSWCLPLLCWSRCANKNAPESSSQLASEA
jgi:hypothetical protein